MNDAVLRLHYEGKSFENTMSLHEMHKVLEGLKEMSKVIYGDEGYEIYIHEILPGSCDIKAILKEYTTQVFAGLTVVAIGALIFTQGKPFTYQINGNNNTVNITNIENESMEFNGGRHLPRILQSSKFRTAGQKLTSPVEDQEDTLTINQCKEVEEIILTPTNKKVFTERNNTIASEKIRGRMYEINIDAESFKIDLPDQERKFTVNINTNAEKSIHDFIPYIGTNHIHLIGTAKRNMEGEIVNFSVINYEVAQPQLLPQTSE